MSGGLIDYAGLADDVLAGLNSVYVPQWKPNTAYTSGQFVLNPSGQIVSANTAFTSGSSYSASNWTAVSGGGGSTAVTTYASGLAVTAGQLVAHQGITYRVTANHTTGALPDLSKMVAFNAEPSIFYPESYGAIGDGTAHPLSEVYGSLGAAQAVYPFAQALTDTLDQCGIQTAINAAVAAGPGVVQLADKTYVVDGSLRTAGNGYALLYIPALSTAGAQSANIEIRGASSGTGFGKTTGDASGGSNASIIKTTLTGQTLGTGSKIPCVIGGPSAETAQAFTAVDLTIRNLLVQLPTNPTMAGIDLDRVERVYLDGVSVNTVNAPSVQPTTAHAIGVRMPDVTNFGMSRVGSLGVYGFYAAVVANTEHFNADDLTLKYNYGGLCLTGNNGWHGSNISKLMCEWQCYHIASWALTGIQQLPGTYPAIINIDLFDIEDAASGWYATNTHIVDDNNMMRGRIQYLRAVAAGGAGPTNGLILRGATKVTLVDLFQPGVTVTGSPTTGQVLTATSATAATWQAAASGGSSGLLAVQKYNPGTVTTYTSTSSTIADLDATNLAVTFTAPTSGNVLVTLDGFAAAGGSSTYSWSIRSGSTIVDETAVAYWYTNTQTRSTARFYVAGLTPGNSYTYKWAHRDTFGSGSSTTRVGGTPSAGDPGPALMTVTAA